MEWNVQLKKIMRKNVKYLKKATIRKTYKKYF